MPISADCMRSRTVHANCDACGKRPEVLHMPTKARGWYCEDCCPACSALPVDGKPEGTD